MTADATTGWPRPTAGSFLARHTRLLERAGAVLTGVLLLLAALGAGLVG